MTTPTFKTLSMSALKPGVYGEIRTDTGVSGLASTKQLLLLIGQKMAAGSKAAGEAFQIYSPAEAASYFGSGSVLHRMALMAFAASDSMPVWAIAQEDPSGATAATATVTLTGTAATAAGSLNVIIGNDLLQVTIATAGTPSAAAAALAAAVNAKVELPCTAAAAAGVVTLTAKNSGLVGNQLQVSASLDGAPGITAASVDFAGGVGSPTLQTSLDAVFAKRFHVIAMQSAVAADLATLKTHLEAVSTAVEQRGARGFAAVTKDVSLADALSLGTSTNDELVHVAYGPGCANAGYEIAASLGAIVAAQEDPAVPFDGVEIPNAALPPVSSRLSRAQQESLLASGVTPLEVVDNALTIVRLVTTRTLTAGVQDLTLLDTNTMAILFYFRDCLISRIKLKFAQAKLTDNTLIGLRSEVLAVAYELQEQEILQHIADYQDQFTVSRDSEHSGRALISTPAPVVPGLHQVYDRIDLLTI